MMKKIPTKVNLIPTLGKFIKFESSNYIGIGYLKVFDSKREQDYQPNHSQINSIILFYKVSKLLHFRKKTN